MDDILPLLNFAHIHPALDNYPLRHRMLYYPNTRRQVIITVPR